MQRKLKKFSCSSTLYRRTGPWKDGSDKFRFMRPVHSRWKNAAERHLFKSQFSRSQSNLSVSSLFHQNVSCLFTFSLQTFSCLFTKKSWFCQEIDSGKVSFQGLSSMRLTVKNFFINPLLRLWNNFLIKLSNTFITSSFLSPWRIQLANSCIQGTQSMDTMALVICCCWSLSFGLTGADE